MFVQIFTGSIKSAKIKLIYMSTSPAAPVERRKTKIATHQLCVSKQSQSGGCSSLSRDLCLPSDSQLFQEDSEEFQNHLRDIISLVCPSLAQGLLPVGPETPDPGGRCSNQLEKKKFVKYLRVLLKPCVPILGCYILVSLHLMLHFTQ